MQIFAQLMRILPKQWRFALRMKNDYRKVTGLKLGVSNVLLDEEDQLFIKVDREM